MSKIIIAPNEEVFDGPLVLLLGPTCGVDWQTDAISYLSVNPNMNVASSRWSNESGKPASDEDKVVYKEWLKKYTKCADEDGAIVFWFPKDQTFDRDKEIFHLGEIMERYRNGGPKVFFGFEDISEMDRADWDSDKIFSSLEDICGEVLKLFS